MKRIEKAYEQCPNGIIYGGKGTSIDECRLQNYGCCPHFLGLGDDIDEFTKIGNCGDVKGCRGIKCQECWDKEIGN